MRSTGWQVPRVTGVVVGWRRTCRRGGWKQGKLKGALAFVSQERHGHILLHQVRSTQTTAGDGSCGGLAAGGATIDVGRRR